MERNGQNRIGLEREEGIRNQKERNRIQAMNKEGRSDSNRE